MNKLFQKAGDLLFKAKTYWKKPQPGYQVSIKEFVYYALGSGGPSFLSVIITYTSLATSVNIMVAYFGLTTGLAWLLGIIGSGLALLRAPILSMIIDKSKSDKGKFKPFLLWSTIGAVVCFGIIPFIPLTWTKNVAFSFEMFAIPILNIEKEMVDVTVGVILVFVLNQLGTFFHTLLTQCVAGVDQTISMVAQERANMQALKGLICNIPASLVNMIIPILVGLFFTVEGVPETANGYNNIALYRWVFPFCAIGSVILILFMIRGTQERVVIGTKRKAQNNFFKDMWELTKNKYFWIINIFNVVVGIRALANITTWLQQYTYTSGLGKTLVGLFCTTLLMNVFIIGMLVGPLLIKKFGKQKVLLVSAIIYAGAIGLQLLAYNKPLIILATQLLQNTAGGFGYLSGIMTCDVLDYHQYKTGKRVEGTWQNYAVIVTTILGVFTSLLSPIFLQFAGVKFSDYLPDKLADETMRYEIYKYQTLLAFIAGIVAIIPLFFYNLSEKKHASIIKVLTIRAGIANYNDNVLEDKDVLGIKEVLDYHKEHNDKYVAEELAKEGVTDTIALILKDYDKVKAEYDKKVREEAIGDFIRECELEIKRVENTHQKAIEKLTKLAKKNAQKENKPFDESMVVYDRETKNKELWSRQRYLRYFDREELREYNDMQSINDNIDTVYSVFEGIWQEEALQRLADNILKEEDMMKAKLEQSRQKAESNGKAFDEQKFVQNFIAKSKYLKDSDKYKHNDND